MNVTKNLVYDIGLHDGKDTDYYLHKGYNVVAVDANPVMIRRAEKKYATAIREGRLVLLNVAISDVEAEVSFTISEEDQFSSLDEGAAKRGGISKKVTVHSKKLSTLFAEHGVPHYCKIDIEGHDSIALQTLAQDSLPPYISVEAEMVPYNSSIQEPDTLLNLQLLKQLGYRQFKLVDQDTLSPLAPDEQFYFNTPAPSTAIVVRGVRFLKRKLGFSKLPSYLQHLKDRTGYTFLRDSSGPFGEEVEGEWYDYETAKRMILKQRKDYHALDRAVYYGFWCDWHAKL
ncbi:MAG: FkbM family methyltransferase [Bacteroidetes bacterium]|nr:FkbM family methyltransferase [Bacteroidota bacterium]